MSELNALITEKVVDFRKEVLEIFKKHHPVFYAALDRFFKARPVKIGFQVTQDGKVVGDYTFVLEGIQISEVKTGILEPKFEIPFWGDIKLYAVMEKKEIEAMLEDKALLTEHIFKNVIRYLPKVTIKFHE